MKQARKTTASYTIEAGSKNDGFIRTRKKGGNCGTVAQLFAIPADDYLKFLQGYERWYSDLSTTETLVGKGSDVPIPKQEDLVSSQEGNAKKALALAQAQAQAQATQHLKADLTEGCRHKGSQDSQYDRRA